MVFLEFVPGIKHINVKKRLSKINKIWKTTKHLIQYHTKEVIYVEWMKYSTVLYLIICDMFLIILLIVTTLNWCPFMAAITLAPTWMNKLYAQN